METCQGPRTVTSKPHFEVPPLACDCHMHIIGPVSRFPYTPKRSYTPVDCLPSDYLRMAASLGVERMVIVQPSVYGGDNSRTMTAVAEFGLHRARAVAMVDETVTDRTLRELADGGCKGIRFMAVSPGGPTLDHLNGVAKKIAPFGLHIEICFPYQQWPEMLPVIGKLPVPVALDHLGLLPIDIPADHPTMRGILNLMEAGRCWVKLGPHRVSRTGPPFADVAPLATRFIKHALERCIWGSDWPHTSTVGYMPDDGEMLDVLPTWAPDATSRHKILVENPAVLYGFS